ncbi:MAG: protease modulator HflC [Rhodospirillaceae bacterium]
MNRSLLISGIGIVVGALVLFSSMFIVHQTQQALVLQFGDPKRQITNPGLEFKIPFIQDVVYFERRVLDIDPPRQQVLLASQKRLDVDSYARFRIVDPLEFYKTVRNERGARAQLSGIINSTLRRVLGNETLKEILSNKRVAIMADIRQQVNAAVDRFGIEIIEVRLRRADYPKETSNNIYDRMKSEREQEAREFRAQGAEQAQQIRADADKQRTILVAEAKQKSETLRGEGDGLAIKIYADAFGQDPEFYGFYRSMLAYRKAMTDGDTTLVLSPDSDFFRYFKDIGGSSATDK